jgi:bifunctional ADP-heptose synthase (sugar kinase/adenylyltransferase)
METAMALANAAASIVVAKVGTEPIHWDDLAQLLEKQDTPLNAPFRSSE